MNSRVEGSVLRAGLFASIGFDDTRCLQCGRGRLINGATITRRDAIGITLHKERQRSFVDGLILAATYHPCICSGMDARNGCGGDRQRLSP